jgi:hypothetical protein
MPPARTGIRHVRALELSDLALCGERGTQVRFAPGTGAQADCGVCKVRRQKRIDGGTFAAKRAFAVRMKTAWEQKRLP